MTRAPRNKTITVSDEERQTLQSKLLTAKDLKNDSEWLDRIVCADIAEILPLLPDGFADLIIIDPPYNLNRRFGDNMFMSKSESDYEDYLRSWLPEVCRKLKSDGSLYLCGDWHCTATMQRVLSEELTIINRITWQREKGRGARANWKNSMEDIWFAVKNPDNYHFNLEAVKVRRQVRAPYREGGTPKDWKQSTGGKYRDTCPGNFWDDISIPFWSMPENTEHPTQKPEKLYAKLILASSRKGDIIFDPFLGSGTSAVVAKKLGRYFVGTEIDNDFCLVAQKRLSLAETTPQIQGYTDGVFWERNTTPQMIKNCRK